MRVQRPNDDEQVQGTGIGAKNGNTKASERVSWWSRVINFIKSLFNF